MIALQFHVRPRGRDPRWVVTIGNSLYGAYLDGSGRCSTRSMRRAMPCKRATKPRFGSKTAQPRFGSYSRGHHPWTGLDSGRRLRLRRVDVRGWAQSSYNYRRIEDAYYARKAELRCLGERDALPIVACNTVDEFARATTVLIHPPDTSLKAERQLGLQNVGAVETTGPRPGSRHAA
jgi:hypothetical protein